MRTFNAVISAVLAITLSGRSVLALDAPTDLDLKAGYCMGSDRVHLANVDKSSAAADATAKSRSDFQTRIDRLRDFIAAKGLAPPGEQDPSPIGRAEQQGQEDARRCVEDLHIKMPGCVTHCLKTTDTKATREACVIGCYDTEACKSVKSCAPFEQQLP